MVADYFQNAVTSLISNIWLHDEAWNISVEKCLFKFIFPWYIIIEDFYLDEFISKFEFPRKATHSLI